MGELSDQLAIHRTSLENHIDQEGDYVKRNWTVVEPLMNSWWTAYKKWEANDKFHRAFKDRRMTVRTFPGGVGAFDKQVSKEFKRGTISLASSTSTETEVRIFADSKYTPLGSDAVMQEHDKIFHKTDEAQKYRAARGIDSSAFANPGQLREP